LVGKVASPSQVAHPSHILQASDSMEKGSIALCPVPFQPSLLPPMAGFISLQARELPMSSCF